MERGVVPAIIPAGNMGGGWRGGGGGPRPPPRAVAGEAKETSLNEEEGSLPSSERLGVLPRRTAGRERSARGGGGGGGPE